MFTEEQLNEILAVCEKSPLGPWKYEREEQSTGAESGLKLVFETVVDANGVRILRSNDKWLAQFIALARTAFPWLAEDYRKLLAVAETAKKLRCGQQRTYQTCHISPCQWHDSPDCDCEKIFDALIAAGYGGEE